MKSYNQMPGNSRDYAGSNIPDNKKQDSNHVQKGQTTSSNNEDDQSKKGKAIYIKDMPEIKPARPGIM